MRTTWKATPRRLHSGARPELPPRGALALRDEREVLLAGAHRVDDLLGAIILDQYHQLEKTSVGVKPQAQLALRVLLIQWRYVHRSAGRVNGLLGSDVVLER